MKYYLCRAETARKRYFDGKGAKTREELRKKFGNFLTVDYRVQATVDNPRGIVPHIHSIDDVVAEADSYEVNEGSLPVVALVCMSVDASLALFSGLFFFRFWHWYIPLLLVIACIWKVQTNRMWWEWAEERPGKMADAFNESKIKASKRPIAHPDDIPDEAHRYPAGLEPLVRMAAMVGFSGLLAEMLNVSRQTIPAGANVLSGTLWPSGIPPGGQLPTAVPVIRDIVRSDGTPVPRVCPSAVSHNCPDGAIEVCEHAMPHSEVADCNDTHTHCPACVPHLERRETGDRQFDANRTYEEMVRRWLQIRGINPDALPMGMSNPVVVAPNTPNTPPPPVPAVPSGRKILIKDKKPEEAP